MKIAIIGAGLNGLSLALMLSRFGMSVEIFEKGRGPRDAGSGIFVWPQGVQVLRFIAGDNRFCQEGQPIEYFNTYDRAGTPVHEQSVRLDGYEFTAQAVMFLRQGLFARLTEMNELNTIHYGAALKDLVQDEHGVEITLDNGSKRKFDLVIGADGVFSRTREIIAPDCTAKPTGVAACRGIVQFDHEKLKNDGCQIFSYDKSRVVTYPVKNSKKMRYWFVAYQHHDRPLLSQNELVSLLKNIAKPLPRMIAETLPQNILSNHLNAMTGQQCWRSGRIALVGDAAHAMLPTLGYGLTLGLENGFMLAQSLVANCYDNNVEAALARYERRAAKRSMKILRVMADLTQLFYFEEEGSVTPDAIKVHMARFHNLAESTVF